MKMHVGNEVDVEGAVEYLQKYEFKIITLI
ncbi:hypothetical protein J2Z40_003715 [Cytobacillus eiseniae]|uniref:Uncharacterized protein n=1 Tax=Cytobacillus eiseniae TaxID=762947 RepID=A0ABS4RJP9_9BACI|nr:hypothetical protein [Cytobacillus eiseniae]